MFQVPGESAPPPSQESGCRTSLSARTAGQRLPSGRPRGPSRSDALRYALAATRDGSGPSTEPGACPPPLATPAADPAPSAHLVPPTLSWMISPLPAPAKPPPFPAIFPAACSSRRPPQPPAAAAAAGTSESREAVAGQGEGAGGGEGGGGGSASGPGQSSAAAGRQGTISVRPGCGPAGSPPLRPGQAAPPPRSERKMPWQRDST